MQRMTAQDAFQTEPAPLERAVAVDGVERVLRARRREPTLREHQMRERHLVCANQDRKSTRLNSSHSQISYAVFCLKKKNRSQTGRAQVCTPDILQTLSP